MSVKGIRMQRLALAALALVLLALLPAACGIKGDPTLPPGVTDEFPRKYPSPDDT
jgi:predicted small lipoprotein YifL